MNAPSPLEPLLRRALDRLDREEQRAETLEAILLLLEPVPPGRSITDTPAPAKMGQLFRRPPEADDHTRRLVTVGRLAAGAAHDFNNLLAVIHGAAELVRDGLPTGHPLREHAELVVSAARTAGGVTRQILGFARPTPPAPRPLDLSAAVRGLERLLRRVAGDRIRLVLDLAAVPPVCADPGQVDQVVLNLVINARDAIPDRGAIVVRVADADAGRSVVLAVADTGTGMPADVRARACDPFFSTKGDRGTGLGLTTVRDAARAAGGAVEIDSAPGVGTTVRVYWPRLQPA